MQIILVSLKRNYFSCCFYNAGKHVVKLVNLDSPLPALHMPSRWQAGFYPSLHKKREGHYILHFSYCRKNKYHFPIYKSISIWKKWLKEFCSFHIQEKINTGFQYSNQLLFGRWLWKYSAIWDVQKLWRKKTKRLLLPDSPLSSLSSQKKRGTLHCADFE